MHGTLEHLRNANPGKWLLIRLDGPDAEAGTLLAAHEESKAMDEELDSRPFPENMVDGPLYVTYAFAEGEELPAFVF